MCVCAMGYVLCVVMSKSPLITVDNGVSVLLI